MPLIYIFIPAPEIFACADNECAGYSFPVDWWSLGVCAYEMLSGTRPFDIHSATSISDVRALFNMGLQYPSYWNRGVKDLISKLLCNQPGARISSFDELKKVHCLNSVDFDAVLQKKGKPTFIPPKNHLNCDPTYELEEMIIEAKPLHKKKKRLAKQRSLKEMQGSLSLDMEMDLNSDAFLQQLPNFKPYNRELDMVIRERETKERCWEEELRKSMEASNPIECAASLSKKCQTKSTKDQQSEQQQEKPSSNNSSPSANASVIQKIHSLSIESDACS
ncbi:Serine/threonine-protein kinase N [Gryllus bimaculatus]|nr:Serine/threonine-protein kinase N [Gryllus bimaculatus]